MNLTSQRPERAFTLIELLAVIGLIAIMTGALIYGFRGSGQGAALRSAQATISGLLAQARTQAVAQNTEVALAVDADPADRDGYLRTLWIVRQDGSAWRQSGEAAMLPEGVGVVPPNAPPVASGVVWGEARSNALSADCNVITESGATVAGYGVIFAASGNPQAGTGQIFVATASRQSSASPPIRFDNATQVRGVALSRYGAVTYIDDVSGL